MYPSNFSTVLSDILNIRDKVKRNGIPGLMMLTVLDGVTLDVTVLVGIEVLVGVTV